ncbi:MAG: CPBP family intramembrane metalloprotease [Pirellulales bacterium]|nr:CPBP family intramembrane metalloprotease [Pirellulales bacterium]
MASESVLLVLGFVLLSGLAVWGIVFNRLVEGKPVLAVEPRRQVPWTGWDVLAVFAAYVMGLVAVGQLGHILYGARAKAQVVAPGDLSDENPIVQLFAGAAWPAMVVCAVLVVVVAPLCEEVLFRLFLQGWLEKVDRRLRKRTSRPITWLRWGTLAVIVASGMFAMLHLRGEPRRYEPEYLLFLLIGNGLAQCVAAAVGMVLARRTRAATWADLGWQPRKFLSDVGLGLAAFVVAAVPVYVIQHLARQVVPPGAADPIPLFFFALVLGTLYLRTHRIVPAIVTHMALNGVTLLILALSL